MSRPNLLMVMPVMTDRAAPDVREIGVDAGEEREEREEGGEEGDEVDHCCCRLRQVCAG